MIKSENRWIYLHKDIWLIIYFDYFWYNTKKKLKREKKLSKALSDISRKDNIILNKGIKLEKCKTLFKLKIE